MNEMETSHASSTDGEETTGKFQNVRRSSISSGHCQQRSPSQPPHISRQETPRRSRSLEVFFASSLENDPVYHDEPLLMTKIESSEDTADDVHVCLPFEDDPLAGAINEICLDDSEKAQACCPTMCYLKLQATTRGIKGKLTPFGRRMHAMNARRNYRLNTLLSAMVTWTAGERNRRLKSNFRLVDSERVEWQFDQCSICLAPCRFTKKPPCCREVAICQMCWQNYVRQTAENNAVRLKITGSYELRCFACNKFVPYSEALSCTSPEDMDLIRPPGQLTSAAIRCPVCLDIVKQSPAVDKKAAKKLWHKKGGYPFQCSRCRHSFCGTCGLADHPHLTCKELTRTDIGLERWARQKHRNRPEFPNCRRCPSCSIPLSHSGGCPHMTCVCGAEFCYSCGRRYGFEFVHQIHMSEQFRLLPFVTCSKLWRSKRKRLLVHSLVSFGIVFGVAPLTIALSPLIVPVVAGLYLASKYGK